MSAVEDIKPYGDDGREKAPQVESMFDSIAPAYDFMNHAMTAGLDRLWLRRLVGEAANGNPARILDMATGTGDLALALARRIPEADITGMDLSDGMLSKARAKKGAAGIKFVQADCCATGLPDGSFDLITIAYGLRNFADISTGLAEMLRLLRPGGKLLVLELSRPTSPIPAAFYNIYTATVIPVAGKLVSGDSNAYSYLPRSIAACPARGQMTALMDAAGFVDSSFRSLTMGVCTLYKAFKP